MTRPMPGPPECECPEAPEHLWTTHYGAVDPGSMIEHNPECPVHRVDPQDSRLPDSWVRALNNPTPSRDHDREPPHPAHEGDHPVSTNTDTHPPIIENPHPLVFEDADLDDIRPGDHVTWKHAWESNGLTFTEIREGIAHHQDEFGDWRTEEEGLLTYQGAESSTVTITIRRTVQDLPTEDGAVIIPADGHDYITATVNGAIYRAREAMQVGGQWRAAWRTSTGAWFGILSPECITPDCWKVADQ